MPAYTNALQISWEGKGIPYGQIPQDGGAPLFTDTKNLNQ